MFACISKFCSSTAISQFLCSRFLPVSQLPALGWGSRGIRAQLSSYGNKSAFFGRVPTCCSWPSAEMNARQSWSKQSPGHFCSAHQHSSVSAQEDKASLPAPLSPLHPSDQRNEQAESLFTPCALQSRWQDGLISSFTLKMPTNIWHELSFLATHMNLQEKINQKTPQPVYIP